MLSTKELIITISIIALITFATRIIPFIIFPDNKETPKYISYLGKVLSFAIIGMLIVYCLKDFSLLNYPNLLPELIAISAIVAIHLLKRNTLLSIGGGTILYMILVQYVF